MKADNKNSFKIFFLSKTFIAVFCILLGVGATLLAQNVRDRKVNNYGQDFFYVPKMIEVNDNLLFPDHSAIIAEMENMEKRMNDVFKVHHKHMKEVFEASKSNNSNASRASLSSKEDNNFYYYELNFFGFKKEDIVVGVKDNVLTFFAQSKKEVGNKKQKSQAVSNFHYSFLVPEYDTKKEPEIVREDNKITVKLTKKNHS